LRALGLLALALTCLPMAALAQDSVAELGDIIVTAKRVERPIKLTDRLTVYGELQASFSTNLADPDRRKGANRLRLAHPDHNAFSIPYAKLGVARELSGLNEFDAGFRFEVGAGRMVEEVFRDPVLGDVGITIPQAYVDLQLPALSEPLHVRFGRQYSWFGAESLDLSSNPHLSRSLASLATPQTVTGASLGFDLAPGLRYTQFVVQGWDVVEDQNDAKTLGGQVLWTARDAGLALNWILGDESPDADTLLGGDELRWVVELAALLQPTRHTEVRASALYGQEDFRDDTFRFGGGMLSVTQGFFPVEGEGYARFTGGLRASVLWTDGGPRDELLAEITATVGLNLTANASLRAEYRHDFSSRGDGFLGRRGGPTHGGQDTFTFAFDYRF